MEYGNIATPLPADVDGSTVTIMESLYQGSVTKRVKYFRIKVRVLNVEQEQAEYLKFSKQIQKSKADGTLHLDREHKSTHPSFQTEYPRHRDGSYFVWKCWGEVI